MARKPSLRETITTAAEGAGGADDPASKVQDLLDCMAQYHREFEKWEKRADKVLKRYRDETREMRTNGEAKFNILWSNVQTLVPATFSKLPKPDVSRRFKDQDPTGRVASMLLERGLEFEIDHYEDYRATMRQCVMDRFLGGRGTAWIRYEPHFKGNDQKAGEDGSQITEDTDEAPMDEAIDYECAPVDYVHWRDFGHDVARTWEEVTKVWRNVYMSEDAVRARFGEEVAKSIPYDASPETTSKKDKMAQETVKKQALIIELWDKQAGKAYWFSKSQKKILDEKEDPLRLQSFFPCPRPLYATLTNDTLVPVPDFTLYQDQAKTLDVLADRMDGLARMLQVKGIYDASIPELARLFTEGENGTLIPGKDWARFAEKNGLKGSLQMVELKDIYEALRACADTMAQEKEQVYEITGISDIIRGQTAASETATAQQIKGQYASLRLRSMQDEVARFATECLQLKAQVICGHFSASTIAAISAADQLSDEDKALVYTAPQPAPALPGQPPMPPEAPQPTGPAMALLIGPERLADPEADSPNPMRSFRIEVAADTLVQLDEEAEKKSRLEFVETVGAAFEKALPVVQAAPQIGPLILELIAFGVRGFKVGKGIEGQIDATIDAMKKAAAQPQPPKPDPEMMKIQAQQQADQMTAQREAAKEQAAAQLEQQRLVADERAAVREDEFNRWKVEQETDRAIIVAEIAAAKVANDAQTAEADAEAGVDTGGTGRPKRVNPLKKIAESQTEHHAAVEDHVKRIDSNHSQLVKAIEQHLQNQAAEAEAPVRLHRGPDGKVAAVQKGSKTIPVLRGADGKVQGMGTLQ